MGSLDYAEVRVALLFGGFLDFASRGAEPKVANFAHNLKVSLGDCSGAQLFGQSGVFPLQCFQVLLSSGTAA